MAQRQGMCSPRRAVRRAGIFFLSILIKGTSRARVSRQPPTVLPLLSLLSPITVAPKCDPAFVLILKRRYGGAAVAAGTIVVRNGTRSFESDL